MNRKFVSVNKQTRKGFLCLRDIMGGKHNTRNQSAGEAGHGETVGKSKFQTTTEVLLKHQIKLEELQHRLSRFGSAKTAEENRGS